MILAKKSAELRVQEGGMKGLGHGELEHNFFAVNHGGTGPA